MRSSIFAPMRECARMTSHSSLSSGPCFKRISVGGRDLADVVQRSGERRQVLHLGAHTHGLRQTAAPHADGAGMIARRGIAGVDRGEQRRNHFVAAHELRGIDLTRGRAVAMETFLEFVGTHREITDDLVAVAAVGDVKRRDGGAGDHDDARVFESVGRGVFFGIGPDVDDVAIADFRAPDRDGPKSPRRTRSRRCRPGGSGLGFARRT